MDGADFFSAENKTGIQNPKLAAMEILCFAGSSFTSQIDE
jgi:hypothetical protein